MPPSHRAPRRPSHRSFIDHLARFGRGRSNAEIRAEGTRLEAHKGEAKAVGAHLDRQWRSAKNAREVAAATPEPASPNRFPSALI